VNGRFHRNDTAKPPIALDEERAVLSVYDIPLGYAGNPTIVSTAC
jgi:hypothetical protein